MKKIIFFPILLLAVVISKTCFAQSFKVPVQSRYRTNSSLSTVVRLNDPAVVKSINKDAVNDRIQKAFNRLFTDAREDRWYSLDKKYKTFGVYFDYNGRYARAVYTRNGAMLYSIVTASENHLPKEDRIVIKTNYFDYDITNVLEVTANGKTVWIVNLQDAVHIVTVRTENGNLDELKKYIRDKTKR